jgi:hypothetical protein
MFRTALLIPGVLFFSLCATAAQAQKDAPPATPFPGVQVARVPEVLYHHLPTLPKGQGVIVE